jgi:CelD/BcsL family acetyltransferase involved in cellulose biosynthesis
VRAAAGTSPSPRDAAIFACHDLAVFACHDDAAIDALADEWRALHAAAPATPFQSWEWASAWWTHRRRGELWLLGARAGDRLVALLPLLLVRVGPLRRLAFLGAPDADYQDLLALPEHASAARDAFFAWLTSRGGWDVIDLTDVPRASPLAALTAPSQSVRVTVTPHRVCPYVLLDGDWRAAAGKRLRTRLRQQERRLKRDFDVAFDLARGDDLPPALDDLFWLHNRRWQRRGLRGAFARPSVRRFHREVARRFDARGWLRLHRLRTDGKTRAVFYCFADAQRVYYYLSGFDLVLARYSPGAVLMGHAVAAAHEGGARVFDLLRGDESYKREWGARDDATVRIVLSRRRNFRARVGHALIALDRAAAIVGSRLRNRLWGHRR